MTRLSFFINLFLLAASLTVRRAYADQVYQIDFSNDETLKAVFDSGLRPWRMPGLETRKCKAYNVKISLKLTEYSLPVFDAERIDIGVLKDSKLTQFEAETEKLSIKEARTLMQPYLTLLESSPVKLESFFKAVEAYPSGYSESYSVGVNAWPRFGVFFRKTFNSEKPLAMVLNVNWNRKQKDYKFLENPIPPPPGYENVSMDPPPRSSSQPSPDNSTPIPDRTTQDLTSSPVSKATPSLTPQITGRSQSSSVLPIVIGILLIVAAGFVFYRRK